VTASTIPAKCRGGRVALALPERHDGHAEFLHECLNFTGGWRLPAAGKHQARFHERRRRNTDVIRCQDAIDQFEVAGFAEQDCDNNSSSFG